MHHALVRTAALFRPCLLALALAAAPCAAGELEAMQGAPTAPRLKLEGLDGQLHSLKSHRGQVVLVNFWGTWCPPCVAEMPSLQRLQSQLSDERFTLLTVNYGENAHRVAHFRDQRGLDIRVLLDPDLAAADAWGVDFLPTSFRLDTEGRVRYRAYGELDWDTPEVVDRVERLLREAGAERKR